MAEKKDIPRWAKTLGQAVWDKINELLDDGWQTMNIVRELSIPTDKVRSLQTYVQRHGPRRRLIRFARFKDALLGQIEEFGAGMMKSLAVTVALAASNETKASMQIRALEVMNNFVAVLERLMKSDAKQEDARKRDERTEQGQSDPAQAVRDVLSAYGVRVDGDD